jgi:formylglycine-generating enzyme required for sulfatase activity
MALVPPGCFMMGSENGDPDEKPVTRICFGKPFWIDQTEVTQAQFKSLGGKAAGASYFKGDNRPVERITWFLSRDFCAKRGARLPTEAEWEYAARGPDGLVYPWGNTFVARNVVFGGNSGGQTANVGSKPSGASWVGALDMSGNVWEWTSSIYRLYPYDATDGRESTGGTAEPHVLRGGSWSFVEFYLRSADRYGFDPSGADYIGGFRCARSYG